MNLWQNNRLTKFFYALVLLALVACTPETLMVGVEPSATPAPSPTPLPTATPALARYTNQDYNLSFSYPTSWALAEEPHLITLSRDTVQLRIGYRSAAESIDTTGGRSGLPAGELLYSDKIAFLDGVIPVEQLVFEDRAKVVFYGGAGAFESGALSFSIWLEDLARVSYEELELDATLQTEVKEILESFQWIELVDEQPTPEPAGELRTYLDPNYGFSLRYPAGWSLAPLPSHGVRLTLAEAALEVRAMWLYESVDIWSQPELPAGELRERGTVSLLDQQVPRQVLVDETGDRAVYYNGAGEPIEVPDRIFAIWLQDQGQQGLSAALQGEVDAIVASLSVEPLELPSGEQVVYGWYGSVHSLPAGANFDDYLEVLGERPIQVGIMGADAATESMIVALRDQQEPNKYAHFWGTLTCGVADYGACQLLVSHMRPDGPGPLLNPDPVENWQGTIVTNSAWAQVDDAFVLAGDYPVYYGIWAEDAELALQLEGYRNSYKTVSVWGQLLCGVMDANGCQIQLQRIEELSAPAVGEGPHNHYQDDAHNFEFDFPLEWALTEAANPDGNGKTLRLTRSGSVLRIGYGAQKPGVQVLPTELTFEATHCEATDELGFLGETLQVLACREGDDLQGLVLRNVDETRMSDDSALVLAGELVFSLTLAPAAEGNELDPALVEQTLAILASFDWLE